jgi:hypothetical protein
MKKQKTLIIILLILSSVFCFVGAFLKTQHVACANTLLAIAIALELVFLFLLGSVFYKIKSKDKV